jgi:hypothetical protein
MGPNGSRDSEIRSVPTITNEGINNVQKITPFLWFDNQAEEAAKFYTSVFKNSEGWKNSPLRRRNSEDIAERPAGGIGANH